MTLHYHDTPIELVIFDVDDTLVDSYDMFLSCTRAVATHHGLSLDLFHTYIDEVNRGKRNPVSPIANMVKHIWNHIPYRHAVEIEHRYKTMARTHQYHPKAHALETLAKIKNRGVKIAISSNESLEVATHRLSSIGLTLNIHFNAIICAHGALAKPNEMMALRLCRDLIVPSFKTLFVGDFVTDLKTAHNAGTEYAMVTTGFMDRETLIGHGCTQDRIFENLEVLGKFLAL